MFSSPQVLLVDDDPDITLALSDYLRQEGFDVEVAETGNAALHKGKTQPFDVVLLDVGLPDRDGIEVLVELSQHKPQLPIILLTAVSSLRDTTPPDTLNKAYAYLTKPYRREEIKDVLSRAVMRSREIVKETNTEACDPPMSDLAPLSPSIPQSTQTKNGEEPGSHFQPTLEEFQRLAEYVQLMQFVFEHVPEDILVADSHKRFRYANQAACRSLGYTKEELQGLRIPDIAPHHENQRYQEHLKSLREGKTLSYHTTHRTKHGQDLPMNISIYLFKFQGQEFTCAITTLSQKTARSS